MINNGYQQYKQQSIATMTNGEMLVLLYDECIKRLTIAEFALGKEDYETFGGAVKRRREIINYLSSVLDRKYEISRDLYRMYDYFMYELGRLEAGRNKEIITELKSHISELRDAFKEADRLNASKKTQQNT